MGKLLERSSASLTRSRRSRPGSSRPGADQRAGRRRPDRHQPGGFRQARDAGPAGRDHPRDHPRRGPGQHAATQVPIWLSEGFADYVGYSGLGLPRPRSPADVLGWSPAQGAGPSLPGGRRLRRRPTVDHRAVLLGVVAGLRADLADRYGQRKLLAFYRAAAGAAHAVKGCHATSPTRRRRRRSARCSASPQQSFTKSWLAYLTTLSRQ